MQNATHQPKTTYLKDYTAPAFLIETVDLNFDLQEVITMVTSRLVIKRNPQSEDNWAPLVLDGHNLELISISLDDQTLTLLDYQVANDQLTIADVPDAFVLNITVQIKPRENTELQGLYCSNNIFCTQCEPEGFRRITYFIDRPDVLSRYTTTITADKTRYPVLLSNGNCIAKGDLTNNRHWMTWKDPFKKPCYLFALVAGNLENQHDVFLTQSGRKVTLQVYVDVGNLDKSSYAIQCIKKAMDWDEYVYGREYDLDTFMVVAINDFNMGAMENKGLNIFNAKYILANRNISTDTDYQNILRVIGHEYFHNWSGNRVTCRDWFQLSLKEGLTIFREQQFMEDMTQAAVARIEEVRNLRGRQFLEDAGPLAHPVRPDSYIQINNFYTMTIYNKGSEVIRMLQTLLGREKFREAMDIYFKRFDGQAVTIEDFVQVMEEVSGRDLTQFRLWYSQAGTPELTINYSYDAAKKIVILTAQQTCAPTPGQATKLPFVIPLSISLLDKQGNAIPLQLAEEETEKSVTSRVLEIDRAEETFIFINVQEEPLPVLLQEFSAPVKLNVNYTDDELLFLLQHAEDGFSRWEANYQLMCRIMLDLIKAYQEKRELVLNPKLAQALGKNLTDAMLDKAFSAELFLLPTESYLGELLPVIDVDAVHAVHRFVRAELAKQLHEPMLEYYLHELNTVDHKVDAGVIARRRLKNICLSYLVLLNSSDVYHACLKQFQIARNMTDRLGALAALANIDCPERVEALENFYMMYKNESIVLDKWLSVQAASELPNTLQTVKELMQHPAFQFRNPNKVMALIGAFCNYNQVQFHAKNGEGYQFLTEQVLKLDKLNPQIAARIIEPMLHWRRYDAERQALLRAQLELILRTPKLSKDVFEVVSKSLVEQEINQ